MSLTTTTSMIPLFIAFFKRKSGALFHPHTHFAKTYFEPRNRSTRCEAYVSPQMAVEAMGKDNEAVVFELESIQEFTLSREFCVSLVIDTMLPVRVVPPDEIESYDFATPIVNWCDAKWDRKGPSPVVVRKLVGRTKNLPLLSKLSNEFLDEADRRKSSKAFCLDEIAKGCLDVSWLEGFEHLMKTHAELISPSHLSLAWNDNLTDEEAASATKIFFDNGGTLGEGNILRGCIASFLVKKQKKALQTLFEVPQVKAFLKENADCLTGAFQRAITVEMIDFVISFDITLPKRIIPTYAELLLEDGRSVEDLLNRPEAK